MEANEFILISLLPLILILPFSVTSQKMGSTVLMYSIYMLMSLQTVYIYPNRARILDINLSLGFYREYQ